MILWLSWAPTTLPCLAVGSGPLWTNLCWSQNMCSKLHLSKRHFQWQCAPFEFIWQESRAQCTSVTMVKHTSGHQWIQKWSALKIICSSLFLFQSLNSLGNFFYLFVSASSSLITAVFVEAWHFLTHVCHSFSWFRSRSWLEITSEISQDFGI